MKKRKILSILFRSEIVDYNYRELWILVKTEELGYLFVYREKESNKPIDKVIVRRENRKGEIILELNGDELSSLPLKFRKKLGLPMPKQSKLDVFFSR